MAVRLVPTVSTQTELVVFDRNQGTPCPVEEVAIAVKDCDGSSAWSLRRFSVVTQVIQTVRHVVSSLRSAPKALFLTGALAVAAAGVAVAAVPGSVDAAPANLHYQRGYSVQGSWYCYGWSTYYRCTQHWYRTSNGKIVSTNTAWVPNGLGASSSSVRSSSTHSSSSSSSSSVSYGSSNPGKAAIISEIRAVFGSYANQALAVASCESSLNPNAYNPISVGGAHAEGVFQILSTSTWYSTSYRNQSPYNAYANIHAAYQIFHRDGNSWREWACKP